MAVCMAETTVASTTTVHLEHDAELHPATLFLV